MKIVDLYMAEVVVEITDVSIDDELINYTYNIKKNRYGMKGIFHSSFKYSKIDEATDLLCGIDLNRQIQDRISKYLNHDNICWVRKLW